MLNRRDTSLPGGPRTPRVIQTISWGLAPVAYYRRCRRRHGSVFTMRVLGLGDIVVVSEPAQVREVFGGDPELMHAGEANAVMRPVLGDGSLLLLDGERHLRSRRLLLGPFHGDLAARHGERVAQVAAAAIERWPVGEELVLAERLRPVTFEVIFQLVAGDVEGERGRRLRELLPRMLRLSALDMAVAAAAPRLTESRLLARVHPVLRARREACALLAAEIEAVRAEGGAEGRGDVLAMLAQEPELGVEELCDQLVTLLLAGHETTTTGLAWCCERLMREPQAMVRLRDSLDRGEEDYLDAVIAETLRLRPVVDAVWRRLAAPARIAGYDLPAGTIVMPSIVLDQLSPELGDPETFRPERFLGGSLPPHTNIPFGGGTRRCVGASFALMEMRVVLRALFERLELAPVSQRAERARFHHVTLVPARGARAVASLRPAALRR